MEQLSEGENVLLGSCAAFCEAIVLQPTLYWKNAAQQGLEFTLNPRVLYRGLGASLANEMGQMGFQYGTTGFCKKLILRGKNRSSCNPYEEMFAALLGGALVAPLATTLECTMIQQQRFGGTFLGTPARISKQYGAMSIFRGFIPCAIRDAIYVGGLLGVTPILQNYLMKEHKMSLLTSGFYSSIVGGIFAGFITCPFDAMSTVMKGDMEQNIYGGFVDTLTKRAQGGLPVLFGGVFWRLVNMTLTVYLANEARVRLGPWMFPGKISFED